MRKLDIIVDRIDFDNPSDIDEDMQILLDSLITVMQDTEDLVDYMANATGIARIVEYMPDDAIENAPVFLILDSNDPEGFQNMMLAGLYYQEGLDHVIKKGNKIILRKHTTFIFQSNVDNLDEIIPPGTNIVGALILPEYENLDVTMEILRIKLRDQWKAKMN